MKVLWERRLVPDNHVEEDFLSQLRRNQNVVGYKRRVLIGDASVLLMNITMALNFVLSFVAIYSKGLDPRWLLGCVTALDLMLAVKWFISLGSARTRVTVIKSLIATLLTVVSLTPVFRSLTESISSDSIWAIAGWLLLVNIAVSSRRFPVLSVNTALAATIVLASRLGDSLSVFYFALFNIESFVTLPTVYRWLMIDKGSRAWSRFILFIVSLWSWILTAWILGPLLLGLWVLLESLTIFGVPELFQSLQKYKDRISGPWDMARPVLD